MPLVSIIITSYNYGRFLAEAIDSALNQTYPKIEVIVVDDGSTDNSREIIASYGKRITAVLKENGGQASAFNAGFSISKGDIIIFLDSDDKLSQKVAEMVVKVWRPGVAKVHYRLQLMNFQGNLWNAYIPPAGYSMSSGDLKSKILTQGFYRTSLTSGNAFGRQFLKAVIPIAEEEWRICPDTYLNAQVPFYGEIAAIEEPLGYYRVHGSNASSAIKNKSDIERLVEEINHSNKRESLIRKRASQLNLQVTFESTDIIARKLALLLICSDHNFIKEKSLFSLVFRGLRAIWRESEISVWKQIIISIYFLLVPFIPRFLAKQLTFWYIHPDRRSSFIKRLIS